MNTKCSFCKREDTYCEPVSDAFQRYLPLGFDTLCQECAKRANAMIDERRDWYMKLAWRETAAEAIAFGESRCKPTAWERLKKYFPFSLI